MERFYLELEPPEEAMRSWPHVVVVGGGFAGLKICHCLSNQRVRVTLIDKRNYNLFQPLLYQVASGLVSEADIASPLRQMVGNAPNIQILLGEVVDIDPKARQLLFNGQHYSYDRLILATGSGSTYFGREEWRPLAPPMKILEHADEIRRRLLMALEEAEQTLDPQHRAFLQTVVVVGAGPAGCELAGSLVELMHRAVRRDFKQLSKEDCRVVLVDLVDRGGRLLVDPDFSIPNYPEIRAVGDLCCYGHTLDKTPLPGMAGPAVQAGGWVARDILANFRGETIEPFRWQDLGSMAVIGPWYAVADLRGLQLTGLAGWVVWALAHLAFIPDTENRIALFSKWMWQIATRQRTALLITGRPDQHLGVDVGLFRAPRPTS